MWISTFLSHPRRPRGGQSGREKRRDKSFQAQAEKPLGTDSHRTISKRSSECWLLIGHKKMVCIIVPNRRTASPEFFSRVRKRRLLIRSRLVWLMHQRNTYKQSGIFQFNINATFQNTGSLYQGGGWQRPLILPLFGSLRSPQLRNLSIIR